MNNPYTQDKRLGELTTPFGKDVLVLSRFQGTEGVSELFEIRVDALTQQGPLDLDEALGKHVTIKMKTVGNNQRFFDGFLTEAQWIDTDVSGNTYRLVLRPWLWLLSKRTNSLIFHDKTAPEIITEIFGKHGGIASFENRLTKNYPKLEYCVQFRESDMDFVVRLMEHHGISYAFYHSDGDHKLVMFDSNSVCDHIPGDKRPYYAIAAHHQRDEEHLFAWIPERRFTTGKVTLNDYDFEKPSANMKAEKTGDASYENGKLESYDFPGKYVEQGDGTSYATARLDMERARDGHFNAVGDCVSCAPGTLMQLENHPEGGQNKEYLILRCQHSYEAQQYRSTSRNLSDAGYHGSYEFFESDRPYAPPITTRKPSVQGLQTAKVVGPSGEEIHTDKYGRIRVQFHWDRESEQSMWARVAQVWAGKNWGGVFIPRVGMEVIVSFLEGDPDRPIIVGSVYNQDNMPPYSLPGEKEYAGWKTNSTKGGGGYNELVFYDKKGSELVRHHAEKDLDSTVKNDETFKIGNDRKGEITGNDTLTVNQNIKIKAGMSITIEVGASKITMDTGSIKIESPMIELNATAMLKTKGGALAQHEAGGPMLVKGAVVMIN